jgi:hypothetical protein
VIPDTDWIYDIETYLDLFCVDITHVATRTRFIFEVSDRIDQSAEFTAFIRWLSSINARMFGFNNEGFDYPVIHEMVRRGTFTALDAHRKANTIIGSQDRFGTMVWPSDRIVTQGDLYKIHHFDNMARSTGLKKLEINMRAGRVVDLPYPPDQPTTSAQKDEIIAYMCHDVSETLKFYHATLEQIAFRDQLAITYPTLGDVLNMNDTKIGKKFFEMRLEQNNVPCYERVDGRRQPRQTRRDSIALRDVISPKVQFQHPEFQRVKSWLEQQVLTKQMIEDTLSETVETKGVFKGVTATVDGFTYVFGTGGIHGSVEGQAVHEDDEWEIWDWDVEGYYPNIGASGGYFPAHLSAKFSEIDRELGEERNRVGKKTIIGGVLKLARNGVYGDSNNKYGPFFDPQYTMTITVNGQLLLCVLAEQLRCEDGVEMIQINTDGLTVRIRKSLVGWMKETCAAWEKHTGLKLEYAQYRSMFIRDVNSYLAVGTSGKVKRIGAYAYQTFFDDPHSRERQWHQDHSMLVVRKAAEAQMVHGVPVKDFIMNHRDPFDFQLSVKVPRSSRLLHGETRVQNTSRYYVSTDGHSLTKVMPPINGGAPRQDRWSDDELATAERAALVARREGHDSRSSIAIAALSDYSRSFERPMSVQSGWTVTLTNDMSDFRWENVNWLYYINEARKLII